MTSRKAAGGLGNASTPVEAFSDRSLDKSGDKPASVTLSFPRPEGRVLSVNEAFQIHWAQKRRRLQPWRDEVGFAWLALPKKVRDLVTNVPCRVQVTIGFRTNQSKDPHNYVGTVCKALVDQLVQQRVWPDDSPQWVSVDEPVCEKGDRITVRLVPRE